MVLIVFFCKKTVIPMHSMPWLLESLVIHVFMNTICVRYLLTSWLNHSHKDSGSMGLRDGVEERDTVLVKAGTKMTRVFEMELVFLSRETVPSAPISVTMP